MKRVYVNEEWCLGCHLCEYNCAFANSGMDSMIKALKNVSINPRIQIEECSNISYAVSCRHCEEPLCVKSCISGALSVNKSGVVQIDNNKCVGCYTCIMACPYGAIMPTKNGIVQKCELCINNTCEEPACVTGCINHAIVYEERNKQ